MAATLTTEQRQALGRYRHLWGPRWQFVHSRIFEPVALALRKFWLVRTWPIRRRWAVLQCTLNRHLFEEAPALDYQGEFVAGKPGRYARCIRPGCGVLRGQVKLFQNERWAESDAFMVLVRRSCPDCHGRGYTGMMAVPGGGRAAVPCRCIRVQPAYIQSPPPERLKPWRQKART